MYFLLEKVDFHCQVSLPSHLHHPKSPAEARSNAKVLSFVHRKRSSEAGIQVCATEPDKPVVFLK